MFKKIAKLTQQTVAIDKPDYYGYYDRLLSIVYKINNLSSEILDLVHKMRNDLDKQGISDDILSEDNIDQLLKFIDILNE